MIHIDMDHLSKSCIYFVIRELQDKAIYLCNKNLNFNTKDIKDLSHINLRVGNGLDKRSKELRLHLKAINIAIALLNTELKTRIED